MNNKEIEENFIKKINSEAGVNKLYEDNFFEIILAENFKKTGLLGKMPKKEAPVKFNLHLLSNYLDKHNISKKDFNYKKTIELLEKNLNKTVLEDNAVVYDLSHIIENKRIKEALEKMFKEE